MWEILEVLRRVHRGESQAAIERVTGRTRKTVRRYVALARELGWDPTGAEPDEALARAVVQRLRPVASQPKPGASERQLAAHRDQIRAWLRPGEDRRGLKLTKVHRLLTRQGVDVPYSSLHRFAVAQCGFQERQRLTVRMADTQPGEVAEVDFGRLGIVWDPKTEKRRVHHALLVTLVHSRHQYVHVCASQKLGDVIDGLEDAWSFFGGVPARVIVDNMKTAITKADRYDPIFQRSFEEYARHRGFVIDASVPRHPKGKPKVERNVQYVRENFFRGEEWLDRDHVQREARRWCLEVAGQRVHGTTRKRPLAVFENEERAKLKPLVAEHFDPPAWAEAKVHPDHHVQFQKALYSVPTRHVGKRVTVRGDSKLVRIFVDGELVKTHPRATEGGRSTDYHDYPEELAPYARRDPDALIREGRRQGEHIGSFLGKLLAGDFPWAKLRQAQALLRLSNKYGRDRVNAACRRAVYFELYNTKRVQQIVEHELESDADPDAPRGQLIALPARFLRPANSFSHQPKEEPDGDLSVPDDRDEAPEALGASGDAARPGGVREEGEAP